MQLSMKTTGPCVFTGFVRKASWEIAELQKVRKAEGNAILNTSSLITPWCSEHHVNDICQCNLEHLISPPSVIFDLFKFRCRYQSSCLPVCVLSESHNKRRCTSAHHSHAPLGHTGAQEQVSRFPLTPTPTLEKGWTEATCVFSPNEDY